ncbi:MAG: mismatch-specific DNA-glycosylase [Rhodanobacteraceae bacterium]
MDDNSTAILPDVLQPGLKLVLCGTAPSRRSAADGAYYAHPGNYFWRALHEAGLTPRQFAPAEFRQLTQLGIGLTDLAKCHSGNDSELPNGAFDVPALIDRIRQYAPERIAFTSKNAARAALGHKITRYGAQTDRIHDTAVYVLPSPSGQARGYWDIGPWCALAAVMHVNRA